MTRRRRKRQEQTAEEKVEDYRYDDKRKNNPEVGLANWEQQPKVAERVHYSYDPHLDPELRFDSQAARDDGEARIRAAIDEANPSRRRSLLEPLLRAQRPWLNWAGKAEHTSFDVDTISLHIHERLSTQAIIRAVRKNGEAAAKQLNLFELFADPQLPLSEAVEFYQHNVDWANRLILGDSLVVMNSLLHRELMAGQVQMIYIDPPYGISYNSNFQPRIHQRDVRDGRDEDLTREPEQIKAYRDTWTLGIYSYLTYLRDRLLLSRELLAETGSTSGVFFQTSLYCTGTQRSHISHIACHSKVWERDLAVALDQRCSAVLRYVRNFRLDFTIPYEYQGQTHQYTPDFIVELRRSDGSILHLVLEVKGLVTNRDRRKRGAALRWIDAVNNWGEMGRWTFYEVRDLLETESILDQYARGDRE